MPKHLLDMCQWNDSITYAYESHAYWDKEKKMSRAKRTLIGMVDLDTGEIVATDRRCKKQGKKGNGQ